MTLSQVERQILAALPEGQRLLALYQRAEELQEQADQLDDGDDPRMREIAGEMLGVALEVLTIVDPQGAALLGPLQ